MNTFILWRNSCALCFIVKIFLKFTYDLARRGNILSKCCQWRTPCSNTMSSWMHLVDDTCQSSDLQSFQLPSHKAAEMDAGSFVSPGGRGPSSLGLEMIIIRWLPWARVCSALLGCKTLTPGMMKGKLLLWACQVALIGPPLPHLTTAWPWPDQRCWLAVHSTHWWLHNRKCPLLFEALEIQRSIQFNI